MKAGLIYEIESIKPHAADHEYRVFWETMEQIELADRLGFDSVWTVEHHFLNEFSYCSAPEVFLACVTQRTRQIRVGHGVVVSERADSAATLEETVSTIARFSDSIDVIGVPRLPSDVEAGSQPCFAEIIDKL